MPLSPTSSVASAFQPLRGLPLIFFFCLTCISFLVMPLNLGESEIRSFISSPALQSGLLCALQMLDATWILFGAISTYLFLTKEEGLRTARRWAVILIAAATLLFTFNAITAFPLGPVRYTGIMGWRLLDLTPFTLPLFWFVALICSRYLILSLWPGANRWQLAAGTALMVLLTNLNLEFVAWKVRAYWIWYPDLINVSSWPPLQNFATWFLLSFGLALLLYKERVDLRKFQVYWKPVMILGSINAVFTCIHLVRLLQMRG